MTEDQEIRVSPADRARIVIDITNQVVSYVPLQPLPDPDDIIGKSWCLPPKLTVPLEGS